MDLNDASQNVIQLEGICKYFGGVPANLNVSMSLRRGEILALLGENGSGKTTLMNMLSGVYYPDAGRIFVNGKQAVMHSPADAFRYGIGMVHQHFKLVDLFSAAENLLVGDHGGVALKLKDAVRIMRDMNERYGFNIDPEKKVYNMSVSEKQTVEIMKVLYRGAEMLILDEPTAVLTPQETEHLFTVLRNMRAEGKSIIIITHKLHEVLAISDRVAVLRKGEYIGDVKTSEATQESLTAMMVGKKVELDIGRKEPENRTLRLHIDNLTCLNRYGIRALDNISFDVYGGEILGIAGIAGSGQKELLEAIAGLQTLEAGVTLDYYPPKSAISETLVGCTAKEISDKGIALSFVPEDRLGMGLVGSMGMAENMMLRSYRAGNSMLTDRHAPRVLAEDIRESLGVVTPDISTPVRNLSGGNIQKVLVGREIANAPTVLMTAYAVRGLDIHTSYTIYHLLNKQKERGVAVIYVGEDLDVLLALADRIVVMCGGQVSGIVDARTTTKEEIGLLMTTVQTKEVSSSEE